MESKVENAITCLIKSRTPSEFLEKVSLEELVFKPEAEYLNLDFISKWTMFVLIFFECIGIDFVDFIPFKLNANIVPITYTVKDEKYEKNGFNIFSNESSEHIDKIKEILIIVLKNNQVISGYEIADALYNTFFTVNMERKMDNFKGETENMITLLTDTRIHSLFSEEGNKSLIERVTRRRCTAVDDVYKPYKIKLKNSVERKFKVCPHGVYNTYAVTPSGEYTSICFKNIQNCQ